MKRMITSSNLRRLWPIIPVLAATLLLSEPCLASFESSLIAIKTKLTGVILPVLSVIGLAISALSFFTGHPNAKQHIIYAIFGCLFGFGAQAIVDFIAQTVH